MRTTTSVAAAVLATFAMSAQADAGKRRPGRVRASKVVAPTPAPAEAAPDLLPGLFAEPAPVVVAAAGADIVGKKPALAPGAPAVGEGYDLGWSDRAGDCPSGDAELTMVAQVLTEAQLGEVVREHSAAIEYCWMRTPGKRADATAVLQLAIEPGGSVTHVDVTGVAPAAAACMRQVVARWAFPVTNTPTEAEYPVALHARTRR